LEILLLSVSFQMPIVTVPLLLAIFGFRSTTRSVLLGMGAGFVTVLLWRNVPFIANTGINSVIPGMLANLVFFMGSHYLLRQPGGWVGVKHKVPLKVTQQ